MSHLVTFKVFSQMPTTEIEANNTGWIQDGSCAGELWCVLQ